MFDNFGIWIETLIMLLPFIGVIILAAIIVVPRKPALGLGIIAGTGILGGFFVKRHLKHLFDVEKRLAEHNEMIAEFKKKQKTRFEAVETNRQIVKVLEKRQQELERDAGDHTEELKLLDKEIKERKVLNKNLLENTDAFLAKSERNSAGRLELLRRYRASTAEVETGAGDAVADERIIIEGYFLREV